MADANWKVGNTRPSVVITLDLGNDPESGSPRTLQAGDVVSQIMRPPGGPAITRTLTILSAPSNKLKYTPTAGDFAVPGEYDVEFDLTDSGGKVETIPDDAANNYSYMISAKLPVP